MPDERDIRIIEPSQEVFDIYGYYESIIRRALPDAKIKLIGSFAVPMKGNSELDVLIETNNVEEAQDTLIREGFSKGPIVDGEGFSINREYDIICEAHIVPFDHKKIKRYEFLIHKLQREEELRKRYEDLKTKLDGSSSEVYKEEKNRFLEDNGLI